MGRNGATTTTDNHRTTTVLTAPQAPPTSIGLKQEKSADATLAEYAAFMVDDNWLDEELAVLMEGDVGDYQDFDLDEQNRAIEEEFRAMANGGDGDNAWMTSDEPWDHWGEDNDPETQEVLKVDPNEGMLYVLRRSFVARKANVLTLLKSLSFSFAMRTTMERRLLDWKQSSWNGFQS